MRAVLLLALLALAPAAFADDTIDVELPTEREDGTPIGATLEKWTVVWGPEGGPLDKGAVEVFLPALSVVIPRSGPGVVCYAAFVTTDVGEQGATSDPVCKVVSGPKAKIKAPGLR